VGAILPSPRGLPSRFDVDFERMALKDFGKQTKPLGNFEKH